MRMAPASDGRTTVNQFKVPLRDRIRNAVVGPHGALQKFLRLAAAGTPGTRDGWLPVLMYHRVIKEKPKEDPYTLAVSVAEFRAQMNFLANQGFSVVQLSSLALNRQACPPNPIAITFDDGYSDFFENALPILRHHGFTATVFVVSSRMNGTNEWDHGLTPAAKLMDKQQIIDLKKSGFEIGSHSASHRHLTELNDSELEAEIVGSRSELEAMLGGPVDGFCYPYGNSDARVQRVVKEAGYGYACGIEQPNNHIFNLSRIDAARSDGPDLRWQAGITGLYFRVRTGPLSKVKRASLTVGRRFWPGSDPSRISL